MDTLNGDRVSSEPSKVICDHGLMLGSNARPNGRNPDHNIMTKLLSELQLHPLAWAFLQPVPTDEVPDYLEVVKKPMGMSAIILFVVLFTNSLGVRRLLYDGA